MTAPAFGHEVIRSFPVHEHCFDCVELYAGCPAWPASTDFACRECSLLPVAGIDGQTGQVFPPSRMGGRKAPRGPSPVPAVKPRQTPAIETPAKPRADAMDGANGRTPSPAAGYGPDGERLCGCGVALKKRQRCCDGCRRQRREEAVRRWQNGKRPARTAQAVSNVSFAGPRTHAIAARSPVDN